MTTPGPVRGAAMVRFFWTPYEETRRDQGRYTHANHEIVKAAKRCLGRHMPVHLARFADGRVTTDPRDLLLGLPTWDETGDLATDWVADNALDAGADAHPNTFVMTPWATPRPVDWKMPHWDRQLAAARWIFALAGPIWREQTEALPIDHPDRRHLAKTTFLPMGVDATRLPFSGERPPRRGRPTLLHISNLTAYKGLPNLLASIHGLEVALVVASMALPEGTHRVNMPNGESFDLRSLGPTDMGSPEFARFCREEVDFYIHTSDGDAQSTALLEACARGVVPLATPRSGFRSPDLIELGDDPAANRAIIRQALEMPDAEYRGRARRLRAQIEREHDWERIFAAIFERMIACARPAALTEHA